MDTHQEGSAKATAAGIAAVRKVVDGYGIPDFLRRKSKGGTGISISPLKRVSDLDDIEWALIGAAWTFGWTRVRVEQAIAEGRDSEEAVRITGLSPEPQDIAVITSILPALADQAQIDWAQPLSAWTKETMTEFLMVAWQLISKTKILRDHGLGKILRKSEVGGNGVGKAIPF
jgi:hypothetical protein